MSIFGKHTKPQAVKAVEQWLQSPEGEDVAYSVYGNKSYEATSLRNKLRAAFMAGVRYAEAST